MGRPSSGWKLRPSRGPGRVRTVRFWIDGVEFERSTGASDPIEAAKEAARIYADAVQRNASKRKRPTGVGPDLEDLIAAWILAISATHDPGTVYTWGEIYANKHWMDHFGASHHLNDAMCSEYMLARLRVVQGETVRKELSALRQFLEWAHSAGYIPEKVKVPSVPKRTLGTRYEKRRRSAAIEISPEETEAIIAALPEWSESKKVAPFPIRARFIVAYETSLRPAALDALEAGVHYSIGNRSIMLTPSLDKNRMGREVPLTERARAALDSVCPKEGLIFGKHDYRNQLRKAVVDALPKDRADLFNGAHLRSAAITHWLERTSNLAAAQYMAGHKRTDTTARYVRPSLRAALSMLQELAPAPKQSKGQSRSK